MRAIQDTIVDAQERLTLSTYTLVGIGGNPALVLEPLQEAIRRGVEVRLFIRQRNTRPEQTQELVALHDMGVTIYGDLRNHAKVAVADGRKGVVFSANLDAQHGLDSGVEVGVVLPDERIARQVLRFLDHAIDNAETEFVRDPELARLDGCLAARWHRKCPLPVTIPVQATKQSWEAATSAMSHGLVLYEQQGETTWRLFAADRQFDLQAHEGAYHLRVSQADVDADKRLGVWLRSARKEDVGGTRGFCASRLKWEEHEEPEC